MLTIHKGLRAPTILRFVQEDYPVQMNVINRVQIYFKEGVCLDTYNLEHEGIINLIENNTAILVFFGLYEKLEIGDYNFYTTVYTPSDSEGIPWGGRPKRLRIRSWPVCQSS